ncbi:MAG TPA: Rieske 2Fe-2S domain-containing protein [Dongiaceae bacterium]|jgi:nitrite reductase/ring-hydroxylating ferredoxin subunit|nr:Rieske 2Fe-2S domain-containing protein [Dongiaceae bacterium]
MSPNPGGEALCRLDEIRDPGSKGFEREEGSIFLIRRGGEVTGYVNSCPHTGGPLDWIEGQFLDLNGQYIVCATHGALFRPGDGHCIAGPCAGDRLKPVAVTLRDGVVYLND